MSKAAPRPTQAPTPDTPPDAPPTAAVLTEPTGAPTRRFAALAGCWVIGVIAAGLWPRALPWCAASATTLAASIALARRRRPTAVRITSLAALVTVAAGWTAARQHYLASDHISQYLTTTAQLAELTGRVEGVANVVRPQRGAFSQFSYEQPSTMFVLNVQTIGDGDERQPVSGRLLAKIGQADHRLVNGAQVEVIGWLSAIDGPYNPGELDYRRVFADRGIDGRLTMNVRGNCRVIDRPRDAPAGPSLRQRVSDAAAASLHIGMQQDAQRLAFLDTILLGRWSRELDTLQSSFRKVGLAHLLSISGAHLAILMGLVWLVVRLAAPNPSRAALVVMAVLVMYLLAVPLRVPIVRAGLMAGLVCIGFATGRRVRAVDMVALAAVAVLIWRPGDLYSAGFQLSFGVVIGLLLFTTRVSQRLWADPVVTAPGDQLRALIVRRGVDYLAVNLVAFLIALPLVAFHFALISPMAVLLSVLAFPVVTVMLGLGYLKILAGLILPSAGVVLAGPLEWVSDTLTGLVEHASGWPAAFVELNGAPSVAWLIATLAVVVALLAGWFARRRVALLLSIAICVGWLVVTHHPKAAPLRRTLAGEPALTVNMFAVGDGSCFLVRSGGHVLMFDCGSQAYLDAGLRSVVPALRALDVERIDTLVLSHADLDHFCGVLDVADHVPIGRVLASPQLLAEAALDADEGNDGRANDGAGNGRRNAGGAASLSTAQFLVRELKKRGLPPQAVSRGWSETWGDAKLELLWPPADFVADRANDTSLVLSVRIAGRRLLLNGDIARVAIPALLDSGADLRADVTDLPHHGSFVPTSPRWLDAVKPTVVLQSSGPSRLRNDRWAGLLADRSIARLVTARRGMVELRIDEGGAITWSSFRRGLDEAQPP